MRTECMFCDEAHSKEEYCRKQRNIDKRHKCTTTDHRTYTPNISERFRDGGLLLHVMDTGVLP